MKKTFTKQYIAANAGCYEGEKIAALLQSAPKKITIADILQSAIPLVDKVWFVCYKCELTMQQQQFLAIGCAELALPTYEAVYPDDTRVRDCITATKQYIVGKIDWQELWREKRAAWAAWDVARTFSFTACAAACAAYYVDSNFAATVSWSVYAVGEEKLLQYLTEFINKIN